MNLLQEYINGRLPSQQGTEELPPDAKRIRASENRAFNNGLPVLTAAFIQREFNVTPVSRDQKPAIQAKPVKPIKDTDPIPFGYMEEEPSERVVEDDQVTVGILPYEQAKAATSSVKTEPKKRVPHEPVITINPADNAPIIQPPIKPILHIT